MKDWEERKNATGNHEQKKSFTLYDPLIYGTHNSVQTIEQVYVNPTKKEIKIWKGILKTFEEYRDKEHVIWCKQVIKEYEDSVAHYESMKHLLGGEHNEKEAS